MLILIHGVFLNIFIRDLYWGIHVFELTHFSFEIKIERSIIRKINEKHLRGTKRI